MKSEVKLQPIRVPNYILAEQEQGRRQDGFKEGIKFHVSELDEDTLNDLCDQFRLDLFAKAGVEPTAEEE